MLNLWYPTATVYRMAAKGNYANGFPMGAVLHFTAGRDNHIATMKSGADAGRAYFCINRKGDVGQGLPLNEWGSHAGESFYDGIGEGVSKHLVGIEICCAGLVSADPPGFRTWWGDKLEASEVRTIKDKPHHGQDGNYHIFTEQQEWAVMDLLQWMKRQAPDIFNIDYILSHEEVAAPRGRKSDPGGALSVPMAILRDRLHQWWQEEKKTQKFSEYINLP